MVCVMGRAMEDIDIKALDSIGGGLGPARVTVDCDKKIRKGNKRERKERD